MAQLDPAQKFSQTSKTPKSNSPTFEQLLQGTERSWSTTISPITYDQEEYTPTHGKKSVITKVKEKAKKLKHSLSGKKKLHENDVHDDNNTPSWGVSLDDEDEEDEDPEYLGAPMYESEQAPEAYKEAARQHPRADPVLSEKHVVPNTIKHEITEHDNKEKLPESPSKTITETVTEKLAPAYAAVSDATHAIASKFSSLTITNTNDQEITQNQSTPKTGHLGQTAEQSASPFSPQKWDKGVSVKEYFVEKFEPGEGERSLSQIITEAMSPRQASGDRGIVEKMKGAVTSFMRTDDSPKSTENSLKISASNNPNISTSATFSPKSPSLSSKNITISTNDNLPKENPISMPHKNPTSTTNETATSFSHLPEFHNASSEFHSASSSPLIPISTSVHEVVEEQSHGRILQPN